jgi:hypothetical protein
MLRHRPFLARDAIRSGLLTENQLRGTAWRRILRGVYADAALRLDHGLKACAAALLIPPGAAVTGISATWLWGARLASADDPVDVVTPPGDRLGVIEKIRTRASPIPDSDVVSVAGIPATTPLRTAWELALRLDLVEAVTYCDALAAQGQIDATSLSGYLRDRAGKYGCRIAKRVFDMVDGRSESPQESRLRVHMALAGLPPPVPQFEVKVDGEFLARVDFAWPELRVAVEYDGLWHADGGQLIRDRARLNQLQAAGWYVHHVTSRDMANVQRTVEAIRKILRQRGNRTD